MIRGKEQQQKDEVALPAGGNVFVSSGVDPAAAAYAQAAQARTPRRLKKHTDRVGGNPVPIPRLDGQHQSGLTMSQQAAMQRPQPTRDEMEREARAAASTLKQAGVAARRTAQPLENSIVEMPSVASMQPQPGGMPNAASYGILPTDTLPPEATKDPEYKAGYGSMFAHTQPQLAMRYGVVRSGALISPHKLRGVEGTPRQLSPQSMKDLETLSHLHQQQKAADVPGLHKTEEEAEAHVRASSPVVQAAESDTSVVPRGRAAKGQEGKGQLLDDIDVDELDIDKMHQRAMKDMLNNEKQREAIEKKLPPIDLSDLIQHNRVQQVVPIVPGFKVTFQSITGEEDLALKRLIMEESSSVEVSDRYLLDKYSIMSLVVGVAAVNGKPLGTHEDAQGHMNDELFWKKFKRLCRLPTHMIASMGVNQFWFEQRVRKLFVAETVGNG